MLLGLLQQGIINTLGGLHLEYLLNYLSFGSHTTSVAFQRDLKSISVAISPAIAGSL